MDFKTFWFGMGLEERNRFATSVDRSAGYLQLVAGGFRRASPGLANVIHDKSDGKVTRHEMREDIFGPPPGQPATGGEGRAAA